MSRSRLQCIFSGMKAGSLPPVHWSCNCGANLRPVVIDPFVKVNEVIESYGTALY